MRVIAVVLGGVIWAGGTAAIRLFGHQLLRPGHAGQTLALYAVSFVSMVFLVTFVCRRVSDDPSSRPVAAMCLMLPTLLLDPLTCLFFPTAFPDVDPAAAGLFGGWMLICCGGAAVAAVRGE